MSGNTVSQSYSVVLKNMSTETAMDEFMRICWKNMEGGIFDYFPKTQTVREGHDQHRIEGAIRIVPFESLPMVEEEILSCYYGEELVYTVKSGPMPVKYHRGTVSFEPTGSDDQDVQVTWAVEYEPVKGFEPLLRMIIQWIFTSGLEALEKRAGKKKGKKSKTT